MVSMSKMPNALLNNAGRLASQDDGIVGNLAAGTQYGFSPHLAQLDAATPLVLRPVQLIVTHVPGMFKYVPGFAQFCKIYFEQLCNEVDGIDLNYSNEGATMPAISDSQTPPVPTDTHREGISPSFTSTEYIGMPIWNFHHEWLLMIKDPDTQAASLSGVIDPNDYIPPHTFSVWSADIMCIQYDTTLRPKNIIRGYQLTAMYPSNIGNAGFTHRNGESTLPERQMQYKAVLQDNANTTAAARMIAETLGLHKVNANFSTPVATDIESLIQGYGVQQETSVDAANYTPLGADASVLSA